MPKWSDSRSESTTAFLKAQLEEAYKRALSLATRLDSSNHVKSQKELTTYRQAVTNLHILHTKLEMSLEATKAEECNWEFPFLKERVEAREVAATRAQHLNNLLMVVVTLQFSYCLYCVLREYPSGQNGFQ